MTDHTWAANAADCAIARAHQHQWGTERYIAEFLTFEELIITEWRWLNHPCYAYAAAAAV